MKDLEVCVVGGGPVGLFAATCLSEQGIAVRVVDAEGQRPVRGYACGLHQQTLRLLDRVGLLPRITSLAHRVERASVYCGMEKVGSLDFARSAASYPHLLTLRQSDLEAALAEGLLERQVEVLQRQQLLELTVGDAFAQAVTVPTIWGSMLSAGLVRDGLAAEQQLHQVEYVIGADGYHSTCREALGIEFSSCWPAQAFAIFEFESDLGNLQHEAQIVVTADSVGAFWPLGPRRGRWTFQVWERLDRDPSLQELQELLHERAPWFRPQPEQVSWSATTQFERRLAKRFGGGRAWLAGEAAHVTSPVGFQNMNRGFVEASELATAIAAALAGTAGGAQGFARFERAQQAEWRRLLGLGTAVVGDHAELHVAAPRLVPCLPATGADLDALLKQLGLRFS